MEVVSKVHVNVVETAVTEDSKTGDIYWEVVRLIISLAIREISFKKCIFLQF